MKNKNQDLSSKVDKLSEILLKKKCTSLGINKKLMFSDEEHYFHPQGIREIHSINCKKSPKYSFLRRYFAKKELEKIYETSQNEEIKEKTKEILSKVYPEQNY